MKKIGLYVFISLFLSNFGANAQINDEPPSVERMMKDPQYMAQVMMSQYDFDHDGKITEKEFLVANGNTGYRAHLSNVYKALYTMEKDDISENVYWYIELLSPAKYRQDLAAYFDLSDKNKAGYITTDEYTATFKGDYPSEFWAEFAKAMDVNHDGRISQTEYVNFDFVLTDSGGREVFGNFDTNGDGAITIEEMSAYWNAKMSGNMQ